MGLQPDAVLVRRVGGPELDLAVGEGGGDGLDDRADLFLKAACCAASARTWRGRGSASRAPEAHQVDPAQLARDRPAQSLAHPLRDEPPRPQVAARRRALHRGQQVRPLLLRQRQRLAPRMRPPPIRHPCRPQRVVALDHLTRSSRGRSRCCARSPSPSAPGSPATRSATTSAPPPRWPSGSGVLPHPR